MAGQRAPLSMPPPLVEVTPGKDGVIYVEHPRPLPDYPPSIIHNLRFWSDETPGRDWLAVRGADGGWERRTYGQARRQADAVGQALLDLGLEPGDCVLTLGPNSLEHSDMLLGGMTVGVIVAPTSPAYALQSTDFAKLRTVIEICRPKLIFVQDGGLFSPALQGVDTGGAQVVAAENVQPGQIAFSTLLDTRPTEAIERAYEATGPDTIAKILFTSGSTGWPKGVINTQRMLTSNGAMYDFAFPEPEQGNREAILSWLPWNHTMAGNSTYNNVLRHGRTYYVDDGRPLPGQFERTLRNIKAVRPYFWSDVPSGYGLLADALEQDPDLRTAFFGNIEYLIYAAADLSAELRGRLQAMAVAETGRQLPFYCGYGSTEAGPSVTFLNYETPHAGVIGLPPPGIKLKLAPLGEGRYDLRFKGPNLTPGYLRDPEQTAKGLDDEGFFSLGDAVRFVDPDNPAEGLRFAGRMAEDFKLATGTFVLVGAARTKVLGALGSITRDVVLTGQDQSFLGLMIWPNLAEARALIGAEAEALSDEEVTQSPALANAVAERLRVYNSANPGSSTRIARFALLAEPPSVNANEITDKGYVNQRITLSRRKAIVDQIHSADAGPGIFLV